MINSVNLSRNVVYEGLKTAKTGIIGGGIVGLCLVLILGSKMVAESQDFISPGVFAVIPLGLAIGGIAGFVAGYARGVFCRRNPLVEVKGNRC